MRCPKKCVKVIARETVENFNEEWAKLSSQQRFDIMADLIDGTSRLKHTSAILSREMEKKRDYIVERILRERYGEQ